MMRRPERSCRDACHPTRPERRAGLMTLEAVNAERTANRRIRAVSSGSEVRNCNQEMIYA